MKNLILSSVITAFAMQAAYAEDITPTIAQAEIQIGQLQVALGQAHLQIIDLQKKLAEVSAKAKSTDEPTALPQREAAPAPTK